VLIPENVILCFCLQRVLPLAAERRRVCAASGENAANCLFIAKLVMCICSVAHQANSVLSATTLSVHLLRVAHESDCVHASLHSTTLRRLHPALQRRSKAQWLLRC
jgi:hypothetical protein